MENPSASTYFCSVLEQNSPKPLPYAWTSLSYIVNNAEIEHLLLLCLSST